MSSSRTLVLGTLGVFLALAALILGPALIRERTPVAVTGTPPPLNEVSPIAAEPQQTVCVSNVILTPRAEIAELGVDARPEKTRIDLEVWATGPGYTSPRVPVRTDLTGFQPIQARIVPPPREIVGEFCVRNVGDRAASYVGTAEARTRTDQVTRVGNEPIIPDLALTFYEARTTSLLSFLPRMVEYIGAFRGFLSSTALIWGLIVAVLAGVPLAVVFALSRAVRDG